MTMDSIENKVFLFERITQLDVFLDIIDDQLIHILANITIFQGYKIDGLYDGILTERDLVILDKFRDYIDNLTERIEDAQLDLQDEITGYEEGDEE